MSKTDKSNLPEEPQQFQSDFNDAPTASDFNYKNDLNASDVSDFKDNLNADDASDFKNDLNAGGDFDSGDEMHLPDRGTEEAPNGDMQSSSASQQPSGSPNEGGDTKDQNAPSEQGNGSPDSNDGLKNSQAKDSGNADELSQPSKAPEAPDASDMSEVPKASDAPDVEGEGGGQLGAAVTVAKAPSNLGDSVQGASDEGIESNMKDVAVETLKAAPKIAADVATENVPGLVVDAVDYGAKVLPKLIKIAVAVLVCIVLLGFSIIGAVGMLPSILFGGVEEKMEERQIDKAQEAIESFYEDRASEIVRSVVSDIKVEADISTFSSWKRIIAGKNDGYTASVSRINETNSLLTIRNLNENTGAQIVFENVYLNDFAPIRIDKVSMINAYAYKTSFGDDPDFLQGKAVETAKLFETNEDTKWRRKDTSGLKDWLKANKDNLVTYSLTQGEAVTQDGVVYQCFTCSINTIATLDEISATYGFTEEQKEQLQTMSFAGDIYLSAYDDVSEDKILSKNIYPRLDVYTNLVGGSDNLIWSMLPEDYMHLIAEDTSTGTALLINEMLSTAKNEIGYVGTAENSSKYNQFCGTDNVPWSASFLSWVANEVDGKISMANKLLDNVIPKTTDVNYLCGYLFTNNFTWHYASDAYTPQVGDIIFLYSPQQTINPDGSIVTTDTPTVAEVYPNLNVTDTNLRVSSAGIVESSSGGTVTFIFGDSAAESVERMTLDLSSDLIVAYAMPKYENVAGETLVYEGDVLEAGDFLLPFKGTATVTAMFGFYPSGGVHTGLDFACPVGTPVVACNTGTVVRTDPTGARTTYGKYIKIVSQTSSGEIACTYAHMSNLYVKEGEEVSAGQVIGLSGNTGNSTGPHIHLTVEKNNVKTNPALFLRDREKIKLHAKITN